MSFQFGSRHLARRFETGRPIVLAKRAPQDRAEGFLGPPDLCRGGLSWRKRQSSVSERQLKSDPSVQGLPWYPNRPVGRDDDIAAIVDTYAKESPRILTLTRPGGVGETRMAVEGAPLIVDRFPDSVYFVDLSAVQDWRNGGSGDGLRKGATACLRAAG
ncbi:hypothetical protein BH23CHL5_BH23CHL5_26840 [soil metagenome]